MNSQGVTPAKRRQNRGSDVQKRRERGRAAQAAFRQRQIDRINELEAQLQAYSDAMQAVKRACHVCKAALKMSAAIGSGGLPARVANQIIEDLEAAVDQVPQLEDPDTKQAAKTRSAARSEENKSRDTTSSTEAQGESSTSIFSHPVKDLVNGAFTDLGLLPDAQL